MFMACGCMRWWDSGRGLCFLAQYGFLLIRSY